MLLAILKLTSLKLTWAMAPASQTYLQAVVQHSAAVLSKPVTTPPRFQLLSSTILSFQPWHNLLADICDTAQSTTLGNHTGWKIIQEEKKKQKRQQQSLVLSWIPTQVTEQCHKCATLKLLKGRNKQSQKSPKIKKSFTKLMSFLDNSRDH